MRFSYINTIIVIVVVQFLGQRTIRYKYIDLLRFSKKKINVKRKHYEVK